MVGPCELGLRLIPGEGCHWDDGDTVFHVECQRANSGIYGMCVGNRERNIYTCDDLYIYIGEDFVVSELESSKEWLIRRHPLSQKAPPQAKPPDEPRSLEARPEGTQHRSVVAGALIPWWSACHRIPNRGVGGRLQLGRPGG